MKTKQTLKKKLSLNKATISNLKFEDLKKIKGGATGTCANSEFSNCTNKFVVCC
jgi:natural product precursor